MKPQQKYDECLIILSEMHDISHTMIEAGMDEGFNAFELLEEVLKVIKSMEQEHKEPAIKRDKKLLH
jgi:hypothetical protein